MHRLKVVIESLYVLAQSLGGPGLFFIAVLDSSFLSLPEGNDILIVVLSIGQPWERMGYLVGMTILGSIAGCSLLYWVGRRGRGFVKRRGFSADKIRSAELMYQRFGIWSIVVPCIMPPPTPFKIFVLSAGVFGLPYPRFLLAVGLGRTVRYLTWGILAVLYGERAKNYLEQNFIRAGGLLILLLVALLLAYLLYRKFAARSESQPPEVR